MGQLCISLTSVQLWVCLMLRRLLQQSWYISQLWITFVSPSDHLSVGFRSALDQL